jgi:predicted RND superfamily exporter protein
MLGIGLNATSVMALSILLGLSLDDTLYFLGSNYVKGTRGISVLTLEKSIKQNTFPVMVTSLVLAAGFAVLSFSEIQSNRNIGILVAAMLLIAVISDLVIFPVLLRLVAKTKKL